MIERAYVLAERLGLPLWCEDEAGPYQTIPHPGSSWQEESIPATHDHQYIRGKTCKLLTLFRPATGELRAEPVDQSTNAILHPWLQRELRLSLRTVHRLQSWFQKDDAGKRGDPLPAAEHTWIRCSLRCACCSFWIIWQAITVAIWSGGAMNAGLASCTLPVRVVIVEDHWAEGGLGDAVLEAIAGTGFPMLKVIRLAVRTLPGSGKPEQLLDVAGITSTHIVEAARQLRGVPVA